LRALPPASAVINLVQQVLPTLPACFRCRGVALVHCSASRDAFIDKYAVLAIGASCARGLCDIVDFLSEVSPDCNAVLMGELHRPADESSYLA
jgi:hypothetical protein